ncbi:helix-turn-helix domain-containing protein [Mucilaginibacter sp. L3T2-6]|uniref:helix-turn-helix domain-containing protein n=1 Tax=Mucilaginibacter sp. L3T2-6 TaxID=3062491 RepID=UPI002675C636|nr:helix-turn-helix transcriptional regulator [Mucilaginibacter sp. L3T2-6]MDO3641260.1 helix-turn-helix transcriptional regulator [Mucilaginibacter sp. L3T2-6]MDV6213980.1 helix-turn-helix transcriptional regulator [Mucilaginibacter sp. L3T2-6]
MQANRDIEFNVLENNAIGRNLARFRKFKEKKALEVADYIGIGEAAYTKYERGESKITVELIQKVSEYLNIDPLQLLTTNEGHVVENVSNSPFAINGTVQTTNDAQNQAILTLIDSVVEMNKRILELLERSRK